MAKACLRFYYKMILIDDHKGIGEELCPENREMDYLRTKKRSKKMFIEEKNGATKIMNKPQGLRSSFLDKLHPD